MIFGLAIFGKPESAYCGFLFRDGMRKDNRLYLELYHFSLAYIHP